MELTVEVKRKRRTLRHAPHPGLTLQSTVPWVKATSRSSTARPQEKDSLMVRRRSCAVSNHEASHPSRRRFAAPRDDAVACGPYPSRLLTSAALTSAR